MRYLKWNLGYLPAQSAVVVTLQGVESDVFLVDNSNLAAFERGGSFRYSGGHYRRSPARIGVPSAGTWNVVVVPSAGRVTASVSVLPAA